MKRLSLLSFILLFVVSIAGSEVLARGFGGGGGLRAGGGSFGGSSGGAAFRSPSMSRPSPGGSSFSRPTATPSRPQQYARPAAPTSRPTSRPGSGVPQVAGRPGTDRIPSSQPGQRIAGGAGARPSRDQVQQFLHLPQGPAGGRGSDLAKIGAGVAAGALGAEGARRLLEGRLPEGLERPAQLPERPGTGDRPGLGDRPGIADRPRIGDRPFPGDRPGAGDRPVERPTKPTAEQVRNNLHNRYDNVFTPQWWRDHPQAARAYWDNFGKYHWAWNHWWRPATWAAVAGWLAGVGASTSYDEPVYYDYGDNIYYQGEDVYVLGTKVATAGEYYQQADALARSAPDTATSQQDDEWLPLGVFALSQGNAPDSSVVLQLAVNKEGLIGGTYYNAITDTVRPIKGKVDKTSQRAAWTFADGKNTDIIMETGIYNLTLDETEALVHFGKDKTQQWLMVRLQQPDNQKEAGAGAS